MAIYIQSRSTGDFIGFSGRRVAEYPDARKFDTRRQAEAALRGLFHETGGVDAITATIDLEIIED